MVIGRLTRGLGPASMVPVKYRCSVCSHVYDPAEGDPASGIAPGTPFELLPEDWFCPDCGASKADFEPVEE
jgi:rubredoxin